MNRRIGTRIALLACLGLAGCPEDNSAEDLGETVDEAVEDAAEAVDDAADEVEDAVEKAGE